MEPRDYAASVARRWLWVVAAGLVGAVVGGLLALTSPTVYTATTSLYVAPALVDSSEGLGYAAQLGRLTFPSVLALGRSAAVLDRAAAEPEVTATAQELARTVDVEMAPDSSLLTVAAAAGRPDDAAAAARAVATALQATSAAVYRGEDGHALLRMTPVSPAQPPRVASSPQRTRDTALGLAAGLLLAVLLCGVDELARPRVRSVADVAELTDLPVLATMGGRTRAADGPGQRDGARLRWILALAGGGPGGPRRVGLLGARRETRLLLRDVDRAAAEASAPGSDAALPCLVDLEDTAAGSPGSPPDVDAAVVVATQRTTRRALLAAVATAAHLGVPPVGVVLHGGLPSPARWWHRLGTAIRGQASSWPARDTAGRPGAGRRPGTGLLVPVVALFLLGLDYPLPQRATTGFVVAVLLLPVWIGALPRFRGARLLSLLTAAGLVCGLLLAGHAAADHAIDPHELYATTFQVITAMGLIGVLLWSRTRMSLPWVGVAYGAGRLVMGLLQSAGTANAYKFEVSIPLTIVVLSLAALSRRVLVPVIALAVLAALDIASDARSSFGFCVIAAALLLWQTRRSGAVRSHRVWSTILLLGGMGVGAYYAFTELLLVGALGTEVQARTARQIAQSGSLLLGGRPEWTATWALMRARPLGFGLGTVPGPADVAVAKQGMAVTHIPYIGDYLTNYLLAGRVELHSIVADLWSNLGVAGVLIGLTMATLLLGACATLLGRRQLPALPAWATLSSLWFLAFGPLPSNLNDVAFTLGLVLVPVLAGSARAPHAADRTGHHSPAAPRTPLEARA